MNDRKPKKTQAPRTWFRSKTFKVVLSVFLFLLIGASAVTLYYYQYYSRIIDRRLSGEVFQNTARLYAAPYQIYAGQRVTSDAIVARLQRAGLEPEGAAGSNEGTYLVEENRLTIRPAIGDPLRLTFQRNILSRIAKVDGGNLSEAVLPAEMVTNLFDQSREKRRIVEFEELPKVLLDAWISAEDHRFYSHYGIDPVRLVGAVYAAVRNSDRIEGVSTITQQLARNFFLTNERTATRKVHEMFISLLLEQRLTKEQILTMHANEVYLGSRGSFQIHGFGEGAVAFFGKDLTALTLPEAATLAGIPPSPANYSPSRYPDRAKARRNVVLTRMEELGYITAEEATAAKEAEMVVAPLKIDATDAPYLVDFIRDELVKDFAEDTLINDNLRVYTTLDPDLQRAAVEAVENGLKFVEEQIAPRNKGIAPEDIKHPQAALIALDAKTGAIRAMVGGSDYGASQYNRITEAFRQPGSIFKPFVYAAAFEAGLTERRSHPKPEELAQLSALTPQVTDIVPLADPAPENFEEVVEPYRALEYITPVTSYSDEPTTFVYDGEKIYEPNNYKQQYRGSVSVRGALQSSLNVPTVKVAEQIGYERVADLARRAGLNAQIKGYPSIALGAFEVTPLEIAGAYTMFANEGKRLQPHALVRVVAADGSLTKAYKPEPIEAISPQIAYMMTHLMEGVINSGTGGGVRARGFGLPAAGKTGTSRDGWFAGYTKDFVVIAWVGYDDNTDLNIEGGRSALPIWTEFMLKAQQLYPPRDPDSMYFTAPEGIEFVRIDRQSLLPAGPNCVDTYEEAFLSGTVPAGYCPIHEVTISDVIGSGVAQTGRGIGSAVRGIGRFFGGVFGGDDNDDDREDRVPVPEPQAP